MCRNRSARNDFISGHYLGAISFAIGFSVPHLLGHRKRPSAPTPSRGKHLQPAACGIYFSNGHHLVYSKANLLAPLTPDETNCAQIRHHLLSGNAEQEEHIFCVQFLFLLSTTIRTVTTCLFIGPFTGQRHHAELVRGRTSNYCESGPWRTFCCCYCLDAGLLFGHRSGG